MDYESDFDDRFDLEAIPVGCGAARVHPSDFLPKTALEAERKELGAHSFARSEMMAENLLPHLAGAMELIADCFMVMPLFVRSATVQAAMADSLRALKVLEAAVIYHRHPERLVPQRLQSRLPPNAAPKKRRKPRKPTPLPKIIAERMAHELNGHANGTLNGKR